MTFSFNSLAQVQSTLCLLETSEGFNKCDPYKTRDYAAEWYEHIPISKGQFRYYLLSHDPFDPDLERDFVQVGKNPSKYVMTTDKQLIFASRFDKNKV